MKLESLWPYLYFLSTVNEAFEYYLIRIRLASTRSSQRTDGVAGVGARPRTVVCMGSIHCQLTTWHASSCCRGAGEKGQLPFGNGV